MITSPDSPAQSWGVALLIVKPPDWYTSGCTHAQVGAEMDLFSRLFTQCGPLKSNGATEDDEPPPAPPTKLPTSFLESALPTKAEYEASLSLPDDERLAAEGAARAAAAKKQAVASK